MGRDRPAAPGAVPLLRHPRRPRPARDPVAARPRLRHRGPQQRLHQLRRLGPARRPAGRRARRRRRRCARLGFCVSIEHARFMARPLQPPRHPVGRGLGRQPARRTRGRPARPRRRARCRSCSPSTCSTRASTSRRRHRADAAPDREPDPVPPAARPRPAQVTGQGRSAPSSTSSALHRKEFRFDRRYRALLGGTRRDIERAVQQQFPFLPAGCNMELDQKAAEIVLRSLREAIPTRWPAKVDELRSLRRDAARRRPRRRSSTSPASSSTTSTTAVEVLVRPPRGRRRPRACRRTGRDRRCAEAIGRLLHVDDDERIDTYRRLLDVDHAPTSTRCPSGSDGCVHMLVAALADRAITKDTTLQDAVDLLWPTRRCAPSCASCSACSTTQSTTSTRPLATHPDVPLQVHARYTRIEILAALRRRRPAPRSPRGRAASTRPRTRTPTCSPSRSTRAAAASRRPRATATTRSAASSSTGRASRSPEPTARPACATGTTSATAAQSCSSPASARTTERSGSSDPPTYRGHVGERPMAITWELHHPLSGDLYQSFAAAVA